MYIYVYIYIYNSYIILYNSFLIALFSSLYFYLYLGSAGFKFFKGALSGLRQLLAAESPLKIMKNAFYFTSNALFVLKIFKFLS